MGSIRQKQKIVKCIKWAILIAVILAGIDPLEAQTKKGIFRDSIDNAFDISEFLLDLHGFIPLISPITEPAVGYGAFGAAVYFIPKKEQEGKGFQMPDIAGLAGGLTQNGTWFAGAGYFGFWKDNSLRYRGVMGYANVNLLYYGTDNEYLEKNPASFSLKTYLILQQLTFRIARSNFWIGGNYIFNKTKVTFFEESDIPGLDPYDVNLINSGVTLMTQFQTFNNLLSPSKGVGIELDLRSYFEFLGSTMSTQRLSFSTIAYVPVVDRWVAGLRVESLLASQNTPFFMLPFIDLRGVPAMRYLGEMTMVAETEQYVRAYKRWGLVGFAGYGRNIPDIDSWGGGENVWSAGGGFRYLVARQLGLQMGVDVGRGPEDWVFYIIFGSAWLR